LDRFTAYAAEMLTALGLDLNTAATADTPRRYVEALVEATAGYDGDPKLFRIFDLDGPARIDVELNQVVEGPIPVFSLCEHHALPYHGHAYIGYIAHDKIIGLSKLTRLVRIFGRRFSVQERLTRQIAESVEAALDPRGVAVVLEARHLCSQMRGVRESEPSTRTTSWRGAYARDPALRAEFLATCGLNQ
jgi:GTP cyclohydrolase I